MEYKVCSHCKREFPKTKEFFSHDGDRIKSPCKECSKLRSRKYYQQNKEKLKKYSKTRRDLKMNEKINNKKSTIERMKSTGDWKDIKNNENYMISRKGEIYSKFHERVLNPGTKDNGYKSITLWENNVGKSFYVHRLVLFHFNAEQPKETVNHIDGNKENNHISNLEWATYIENNEHARESGLWEGIKENDPNRSIPVEQRDLNGNLIKTYPSFRQAQRETGADATSIGRSVRKGWTVSGHRWYLEGQYKNK